MRVLIICSSLERGKDGVGDYSLKLGNWLAKKGMGVHILAFNDKYLAAAEKATGQKTRYSSNLSISSRREKLQAKINEFQPDVLFLQYVPYGYHNKGIPLNLAKVLGSIKTNGNWFIMVHEPYIGGKLSVKEKIIQFGQKKAVKRIIENTSPSRVFTSTRKYEKALADINIVSSILPLFGNIQITGDKPAKSDESDSLLGIFFGAPPARENYRNFKNGILKASISKPLRIAFCGKTSSTEFAEYMSSSFKDSDLKIETLGELGENELSQLFSNAEFGIARVGPELIGKSGSAISLLEHGLKLWVPLADSQQEIEREIVFRPELCFADLTHLLADDSRPEKISNLDKVGELLQLQLNTAT